MEKLVEELKSKFNQLDVRKASDGIRVSVPNGTKSVLITVKDGLFSVDSDQWHTTYKNLDDVAIEILECLVSREMYDNNFNASEINLVINTLLK